MQILCRKHVLADCEFFFSVFRPLFSPLFFFLLRFGTLLAHTCSTNFVAIPRFFFFPHSNGSPPHFSLPSQQLCDRLPPKTRHVFSCFPSSVAPRPTLLQTLHLFLFFRTTYTAFRWNASRAPHPLPPLFFDANQPPRPR